MTRRGLLAPRAAERPDDRTAEGASLTRRGFLAGVGMVALTGGLAACGGPSLDRVLEEAAAGNDPNSPILVSLYLEGGNDGLNTLVPIRERRYRRLRARTAIDAADTLPLPDTDEFGWHPSLANLARLYADGKVAVLPSVDYAEPDLSHFNSVEYWRTGVVGHGRPTTGWLGRTLDVIGDTENPLQGVSVQDHLDPVLLGARAPVATVLAPDDVAFWLEGLDDETRAAQLLADLAASPARLGGLRAARSAYAGAVTLRGRLATLADAPPERPAGYPDSDLGRALASLARLLAAGFGTRVAAVADTGGYDTHEGQADRHAALLANLDASLGAWQADLERRGLSRRVLTLVWSEFGRRPEDNESGGTDHGAGGVVLLVGDRASGGVRSEFPGLARLDDNANLLVSTEFRAVYATLLEDWMGVEAGRILPGPLPDRLSLVRSA